MLTGAQGFSQLSQWGDGLDFLSHAVVAVIDEPAQVDGVIQELDGRVGDAQVNIAQGTEAFQQLSRATATATFSLMKSLRRLLGQETEHWNYYLESLRAGRVLVRVAVNDLDHKKHLADIFARHGARFVNFYGQWTIERLVY